VTTLDGLLTETLHSDQARRLRGLVEQRQQHRLAANNSTTTTATVIAVTSGKGGVGKSCLALNLSIALARLDVRVALLDTSLGLGHLDLMCGLNGYWNLGHVLAGTRRLPEITLEGPSGIHVIPGAGRLSEFSDGGKPISPDISEQLLTLETGHDVLVLDTGHREHPFVADCLSASDTVLVMTTPEPTALADAYATFKAMSRGASGHLQTLVNRAESARVAEEIHQRLVRTTRIFLEAEPPLAGWIPDDPEMALAIHNRTPLMAQAPDSPAGRAISQLATRLVYHSPKASESVPFFQQLFSSCHHQDNTRVTTS
jgi:flagellar biosynthesis protein FlhG